LQGQLVVTDARLQAPPTLLPTAVQLPVFPINPQLSVTINLSRNVSVERGALKASLLGPITITGTLSRPLVAGTVQITSGKLSYVGRTLTIVPGGTASFAFEPPSPPVISVNLTATTVTTLPSPLTNRVTRYTVFLRVSGPVAKPTVDVSSSPPGLDSIQAMTAVFGGAPAQALAQGISVDQLIRNQFSSILLGFAIPEIFQSLQLGPFVFALEPGFNVPLQVSATTDLTDKISLFYARSVTGVLPTDIFGVDYTLSQKLALTLQFSGLNGSATDTQFLIQYFTRF
jgi:hypothetical protein